jgi:hypothetical protein
MTGLILKTAAVLLVLGSGATQADPLFDAAGRAALGAEIRALLLAEPEVVDRVLHPPTAYDEAVSDDLARLEQLAPQLFDPAGDGFGAADAAQRIALFVRDDCADCARAASDLRTLSAAHDLRVTLHDLDLAAAADLARTLGLTEAPAYVLPGMMLQGHIPPMLLERYLTR